MDDDDLPLDVRNIRSDALGRVDAAVATRGHVYLKVNMASGRPGHWLTDNCEEITALEWLSACNADPNEKPIRFCRVCGLVIKGPNWFWCPICHRQIGLSAREYELFENEIQDLGGITVGSELDWGLD